MARIAQIKTNGIWRYFCGDSGFTIGWPLQGVTQSVFSLILNGGRIPTIYIPHRRNAQIAPDPTILPPTAHPLNSHPTMASFTYLPQIA